MEIRAIKRKIFDSYRKNKDDFRALLLGIYPKFVYRRVDKIQAGEIPIFTFHSVEPKYFEYQLRYLAENNYRTLKADELYNIIIGKKGCPVQVFLNFFKLTRGTGKIDTIQCSDPHVFLAIKIDNLAGITI